MITHLSVSNFGIFSQISLEPHSKLTVITGMTGTGKSLLFDAIASLFTKSTRRIPSPLDSTRSSEVSLHYRINADHVECFEKKTFTSNSFKKNGERTTQAHIQSALSPRISLLQQFNKTWHSIPHNDILYPALCTENSISEYQVALNYYKEQKSRIKQILSLVNNPEKSKAKLTEELKELDDLNVQCAEEEALETEIRNLMAYGRIRELLDTLRACSEHLDALQPLASHLRLRLDKARDSVEDSTYSILERSLNALESGARYLANETENLSESALSESDLDQKITACTHRLKTLQKVASRYGVSVAGLLQKRAELQDIFESIDSLTLKLSSEEQKLEEFKASLEQKAEQLCAMAVKRSTTWMERLQKVLESIDMPEVHLSLHSEHTPESFAAYGDTNLTLCTSILGTAEKQPPHQVFSGGEMTRFTLATQTVSASKDTQVFLFDEVESGLSPNTSFKVGKLLRKIAEKKQVIVITHSPHIACFAHKHFAVIKEKKGPQYLANIHCLESQEERITEMMRMLSNASEKSESVRNVIVDLLKYVQEST